MTVDASTLVRQHDRDHVFHSWSAQAHIAPIPIAGAAGSWFWDYDGHRYLDIGGQMANLQLGHQHPGVLAAIREQLEQFCIIGPMHAVESRSRAARLIAEVAPGPLNKVFFTNGGAEANENAIRMSRLHTGRHKVFAAYRSYHGATAGAITLTGDSRRWGAEPGMPGVVHFCGPFQYRSSFHATSESEECGRALEHLDELLMYEGPHTVAAIIIEPVVGSNGVLVPPPGYLMGVRALCDEYGIVMICDEVLSGFGRCGHWFAADHWHVVPDLITFAKGVNSGYVPLGGVLISDEIAMTFNERTFPGGLTYSGHPLACASVVGAMEALRDEALIERAAKVGADVLGPALGKLLVHPSVGEVRGLGMLWAVELVADRATRQPLVPYAGDRESAKPMAEVAAECKRLGLWPLSMHNRLLIAPPLNIDEEEITFAVEVLDAALKVADRYVGS